MIPYLIIFVFYQIETHLITANLRTLRSNFSHNSKPCGTSLKYRQSLTKLKLIAVIAIKTQQNFTILVAVNLEPGTHELESQHS